MRPDSNTVPSGTAVGRRGDMRREARRGTIAEATSGTCARREKLEPRRPTAGTPGKAVTSVRPQLTCANDSALAEFHARAKPAGFTSPSSEPGSR